MTEFSFGNVPVDAEALRSEAVMAHRATTVTVEAAMEQEAAKKRHITQMTEAAEFRREHVAPLQGGQYGLISLPVNKERVIQTALLLDEVGSYPEFEASALVLSRVEFNAVAAEVAKAALMIRQQTDQTKITVMLQYP